MIIPNDITKYGISLRDQFFDLSGLSSYSSLKVPTLRSYIRFEGLPCFKVKGKILIKKSEFDQWIQRYRINKNQELDAVVDGILGDLKG